jgi:hypothetical protein
LKIHYNIKNIRNKAEATRDKGIGSRLRLAPWALLLVPFLIASTGCNLFKAKKKQINPRVTLRRTDKIPYGTFVAYENLQYLFPNASIELNKHSPSSYKSFTASYDSYISGEDESTTNNSPKTLYVVMSPYFSPNTREIEAIMEFIGKGHHVFISAHNWGNEFKDSLKLQVVKSYDDTYFPDSLTTSVVNPITYDTLSFTYPGMADNAYFTGYDTGFAYLLGWNDLKKVNIVKYNYKSGGSLYLHSAPLAFSNFFLLHKQNHDYYDNVFSHLPKSINRIEWDEYFRYGNRDFSAWQVIMANPGLKAAFWLILLIFLLIYLFESKRKQRIIPRIAPLRNASLDFVKTIGRLYYQYRDNKNLGMKMTAHLMDHVRNRYNIPTSVMDEKFVSNLAHKSGYNKEQLEKLVRYAHIMQYEPRVSDQELMTFHKLTEDFYKHQ